MKILVLDGTHAGAQLVHDLVSHGHDVFHASRVRDALLFALEERPQAAIVDRFAYERPGEEVVRMLRAIDVAMRIVVYSAFNTTESVVQAMRMGATIVLDRPKPIEIVLQAIDHGEVSGSPDDAARPMRLGRWVRGYIDFVLALHRGNKVRAARDLGIDRRTLQRMLQKSA